MFLSEERKNVLPWHQICSKKQSKFSTGWHQGLIRHQLPKKISVQGIHLNLITDETIINSVCNYHNLYVKVFFNCFIISTECTLTLLVQLTGQDYWILFFFQRYRMMKFFCILNTECSWNTPKWSRKREMKQSTQCERGPIALSLMCISWNLFWYQIAANVQYVGVLWLLESMRILWISAHFAHFYYNWRTFHQHIYEETMLLPFWTQLSPLSTS